MFTVRDILIATGGRLLFGNENEILTGLSTDTRRIKGGEVFIAIKGERFDGHHFVLDAISKGAGALIIQEGYRVKVDLQKPGISLICVSDSIRALGDIARYHRARFNIPLVGITGSNGKTTTKEMLAAILSKRGSVLKNLGTENNHIGVPLTLMRLNSSHKMVVLEIATNHIGEVSRLSEIAKPTIAVITNVGPSHLEYLHDINTVFKAKCEILEHIDKDGKVVINGDDELLARLKIGPKIIRFGLNKDWDFYADKLSIEPNSIHFRLNGKWDINLNVVGQHNVYNSLAAVAAGWHLGAGIEEIKDALRDFRVPNMRMEVKTLKGIKIINDSYNSNPLSMKQALETLRDMTTKGRKILVAGDMLELGSFSSRFHHLVGRQAAESGIDLLVAVGRLAEYVVKGAQEAGMNQKKIKLCNATKDACQTVVNLIKEGDTVLVKGSRAMKMEQIIEELEHSLDTAPNCT